MAKGVLEHGLEKIKKLEGQDEVELTNECEALTEDQCHADHVCSWCTSFAVKNKCNTVADAKTLPSSIFICDNLGANNFIL